MSDMRISIGKLGESLARVRSAIERLGAGRRRTFLSAGALRSGESDISVRIEEILRSEVG